MTGYPAPPPPGQPYGQYAAPAPYERAWSGLAIAAFVLALLGFMGCTAILGIILGIAGIVATSGGKRRGMGLAIAAIPLAIITGSISVLFSLGAYRVFQGVAQLPDKIAPILSAKQPETDHVQLLRDLASPALNSALTDEGIQAWLTRVRDKHGTLVKLDVIGSGSGKASQSGDGVMAFDFNGQFVNGAATVTATFRPEEMISGQPRIDDLSVGGITLREVAAGAAAAAPP